jgi:microcystin-dependent protein
MANLQDITNRSEVGTIKPWPKATAPSGYLLCDGTAVSRATYAELYAVTGDTYGAGNGSTTFNVPQLQGKTPQGYDGNTYNLAGTGGANTVTVSLTNNQSVNAVTSTATSNQAVTVTGSISNTSITTAQLASHSHNTNASRLNEPGGQLTGGGGHFFQDANIGNAGSGTGHNHSHTLSGTLTGNVAVTNSGGTLSGTVTGSGTNSFSPYVVVNYIIKH